LAISSVEARPGAELLLWEHAFCLFIREVYLVDWFASVLEWYVVAVDVGRNENF